MKKIAILGSGTWATALSQVLISNNHDVILWGIDSKQIDDINFNHKNSFYFGDEVVLDTKTKATTDLKSALEGVDYVLLSVPSIAIKEVLLKVNEVLDHKVVFINTAKGYDPKNNERLSIIIENTVPSNLKRGVVSLIGPSHAEEVVVKYLTAVCSVCEDNEIAKEVQQLFSNEFFRVYTNNDVAGAETCSAMKNSIAIASGILDGLGYGDNARAALITRGLNEMVTYGLFSGGKHTTFYGLCGLGDLIVTCNSRHSRNFMAGHEIGKSNSAKQFLENNSKTVEGIRTTKVIHEIAIKNGLDLPIINAIYKVIYEDAKPDEIAKQLMIRPLKDEK